jgi:hypothetical protein
MLVMKSGGHWILVLAIIFVTFVVMLFPPTAANPIVSAITKVYIEQDNRPVDSPVNYTMNCYGTYDDFLRSYLEKSRNISPEDPIYSYSLNCTFPGCPLYVDYTTWMMKITSCDIEGTYKGKSFIIRNFSQSPEPECLWTDDHDCEWENEPTCENNLTYFGIRSSESALCRMNFDNTRTQCYRIKEKENNITAAEKEFDQCYKIADSERNRCRNANKTVINLTWNDVRLNPYNKHSPEMFCELRFSIPSDNMTGFSVTTPPRHHPPAQISPVASLYCSIVQFLGGRCE